MDKDVLERLFQNAWAGDKSEETKPQISKQELPFCGIHMNCLCGMKEHIERADGCAALMIACAGQTEHQIKNSGKIRLKEGELLLLSKGAMDQIFFLEENSALVSIKLGTELLLEAFCPEQSEGELSLFLEDCFRQTKEEPGFLYYSVSDEPDIQNILKNVLRELLEDEKRIDILQLLFRLLFLYLSGQKSIFLGKQTEKYGDALLLAAQKYIEQNYRTANLTELAERTNQTVYGLSKLIKQETGCPFKELLQNKRLTVAARLLCDSHLSIRDIILAVGYDNASYFYRIFQEKYAQTPREFRKNRGM